VGRRGSQASRTSQSLKSLIDSVSDAAPTVYFDCMKRPYSTMANTKTWDEGEFPCTLYALSQSTLNVSHVS
jgi:hypothetical protein